MARVGIIGGGIIGLSAAYYLRRAGFDVTVVDQGDLQDGCSVGNAGMIVPSHFIPLSAPGMISKGIRWMFNPRSPFYIRPSLDRDLLKWGYYFYRNATRHQVEKAMPALKDLSLFSKSMYAELSGNLPFDFGYQERGLLMLYQTAETAEEERITVELAHRYGIEARILTGVEVQELEPDVRVSVRGGVYFPGDAHLTPGLLFRGLIAHLKESGVRVITKCEVTDFTISGRRVQGLRTTTGDLDFDEIVLAAGSWSGIVAKKLKLDLPMQAGKGYSFTLPNVASQVRIPSIFLEARVAVTPMGNDLRFGGTMEIAGVNHEVNMNRVRGIVDSIPSYYPDMKVEMPLKEKIWHGLRPCSPDGLPFIGRSAKFDNLIVATGHSMMGVSLAPGTGKLVAEIAGGERSSVNLELFSPGRFDKAINKNVPTKSRDNS